MHLFNQLSLFGVFLIVISSHAAVHVFNRTTHVENVRAQLPEAIIVEYEGMTSANARAIQNKLIEFLDRNVSNQQLTNYMWEYFRIEDPYTIHLVTLSKCFDYCFLGSKPKNFITIDIDRGTNRFMMVGRPKC